MSAVLFVPPLSAAATERTRAVPPERPVLLRLYSRRESAPGTISDGDEVRHDYGFDAIFFVAFNFDGKGSALAVNHLLGKDPELAMYPEGDVAVILGWDDARRPGYLSGYLSEYVLAETVERDMKEERELFEDPRDFDGPSVEAKR